MSPQQEMRDGLILISLSAIRGQDGAQIQKQTKSNHLDLKGSYEIGICCVVMSIAIKVT